MAPAPDHLEACPVPGLSQVDVRDPDRRQVSCHSATDTIHRAVVQTGADGGFRVKRQVRNHPGIDRFRFLATNGVTGERCTAGLQFEF